MSGGIWHNCGREIKQCYGFHSEANEMAIEDTKAIVGKTGK